MDYILKLLNNRIKRFEGKAESKVYYQARVEYCYYLFLAYFWNKNFDKLNDTDFVLQGNIIRDIQNPSIGMVWNLVRKLDIENEIKFQPKKILSKNDYANLRNDKVGHGYSFEDELQAFIADFDNQFKDLFTCNLRILNSQVDLIVVQNFNSEDATFTGTLYDSSGNVESNWKCLKEIKEFQINNLYASFEPNSYFRLSPFIHIDVEIDALYVYRQVQQSLLGKIRYNRIDRSDNKFTIKWPEFEFAATNGIQVKNPNGSIRNVFTANFRKYIEVGSIKQRVYDFLIGKQSGSSVCITLWGHGGNGKTATAQKICEELSLDQSKPFDYLIFLTAKDRELNKVTGKIDQISSENRVTSFEDLIRKINTIIYSTEDESFDALLKETAKSLIFIDDYETFEDLDKEKITEFIKQLNTNHHKVILTTRNSFLKIGDDITINELDLVNTKKFLIEVLTNEFNYSPLQIFELEESLKDAKMLSEIHRLTLGKPIEILRFANCFIQKGRVSEGFLNQMERVNSKSERIEFLYGRNYDQLKGDPIAQDIFVIIGLLTPKDTLTSLVKHIKVILNKKDEDQARINLSLDKLVKLRLIEIDEDGTYKVDNNDILTIMLKEYDNRDARFRQKTSSIYQRIKSNITSDTDRALLNHAKTLRIQANSETTIQQYKEILRQGKDFSYGVKYEALTDLTDFLISYRGDKESAINIFEEFLDQFYTFEIIKRYSNLCWSVDRPKAIRILEKFFSEYEKKGITLQEDHKIHLLALIILREGLYWNDCFEKQLSDRNNIRNEFGRIYNVYGHVLIQYIKSQGKYTFLNAEQKNDVTLALENLIDVLYRKGNVSKAIEISHFAIENVQEHFKQRFTKKLTKVTGKKRWEYKPSTPKL